MSEKKRMPGVAWLIIGVCVTALVLPSAAVAAGALKFTGIQGTSGNRVDVTADGHLLTSEADVNNEIVQYMTLWTVPLGETALYSPPSGKAAVITNVHIDVDVSGAGGALYFYVGPSTACSTYAFAWSTYASTGSVGDTEVPFDPGIAVPAGDTFCFDGKGVGDGTLNISGYTVAGSSVATPAKEPAAAAPRL